MEINKNIQFLRKKSKKVKKITNEIKDFTLQMKKAMEENNGVGLAAPQIGRLERIIAVKGEKEIVFFINPVILKKSKECQVIEEGCLSLPDCFLKIKRPKRITIKALNLKGKEIILNLENLEARVFQHEVDHLDGILIFDRLPLLEKIKRILKSKPFKHRKYEKLK